jgi:hypothetical protein
VPWVGMIVAMFRLSARQCIISFDCHHGLLVAIYSSRIQNRDAAAVAAGADFICGFMQARNAFGHW